MHFVKCKCYGYFEFVNVYGIAQNEVLPRNYKVKNGITQTKCFEKTIENVGVNRAPAWIRQPGRVGDLGHDTFENESLIKPNKMI